MRVKGRNRVVTVRRLERALTGLLTARAALREVDDFDQADQIQTIIGNVDRRLERLEEPT